MKNEQRIEPKICPMCGKEYSAPPALSRVDGRTYICPECGTREALSTLGIDEEDQEHIVDLIYTHEEGGDEE